MRCMTGPKDGVSELVTRAFTRPAVSMAICTLSSFRTGCHDLTDLLAPFGCASPFACYCLFPFIPPPGGRVCASSAGEVYKSAAAPASARRGLASQVRQEIRHRGPDPTGATAECVGADARTRGDAAVRQRRDHLRHRFSQGVNVNSSGDSTLIIRSNVPDRLREKGCVKSVSTEQTNLQSHLPKKWHSCQESSR